MTPISLRGLCLLIACAAPPAQAQISVRSSLSDDHDATPGSTHEGTVRVRNETGVPQQAKVYLTDYLFHADGTNEYGEPGSTPRSNADWIQFSPSVLTLPPKGTGVVQYEVALPPMSDTLRGSYWSLLMVEAVPPDAPESTLTDEPVEPAYGVRPVMRYGVQIATHIGAEEAEITFPRSEIVVAEDGHQLHVDVANEGARMVRPEVWVEVFDESGVSHGRVPGATSRLYPGTSVRQRLHLGELPAGMHKALVVVDAGGDDVYGAEYILRL